MIVVYIHKVERYDLGIGGFKAVFMSLWLFHHRESVLPAMLSVFGCTGLLCHLLQMAELSAQVRGERGVRGACVIHTGITQPKGSGDFKTSLEQRPPQNRFHAM